MTRSDASLVADYLNRIYGGPAGVFCRFSAFSIHRLCTTDVNGFWDYYVTSSDGAFLNGDKLSFKEEREAIRDAMEILQIHD